MKLNKKKIKKIYDEEIKESLNEFDYSKIDKSEILEIYNKNKFKVLKGSCYKSLNSTTGIKPESIAEKYVKRIIQKIGIDGDDIISQAQFKTGRLSGIDDEEKETYRYPDFAFNSKGFHYDSRGILFEIEPIRKKPHAKNHFVNQALDWFHRMPKLLNNYEAIATNLIDWFHIKAEEKGNGLEVIELDPIECLSLIRDRYLGYKSFRIENGKTIDQFFHDFKECLFKIVGEDNDFKIMNDDQLNDGQRIQYFRTIFFRILFIRILYSWEILNIDPIDDYVFSNNDPSIISTKLNLLFFNVFNEEIQKRDEDLKKLEIIPYLNGGLFRKTIIENENPRLHLNSNSIQLIYELIKGYNYKPNEKINNENEENNVITPKVLGHIFELTIDQTGGDRKGSGSYYTPKTITNYISKKSINNYILNKVNKKINEWNESGDEILPLNNLNYAHIRHDKYLELSYYILELLSDMKVLDNACGSGAFLTSATKYLVEIYYKMYENLGIIQNGNLPYYVEDGKNESKKGIFKDLYSLRRHILNKNIYGCDIQDEAIEIAKIRLWLWLMDLTDFRGNRIEDANRFIEPLPNIEYNVLCGNSLFGFNDVGEILKVMKSKLLVNKKIIEKVMKLKKKYKNQKDSSMAKKLKSEIEGMNESLYAELNSLYLESKFENISIPFLPIVFTEKEITFGDNVLLNIDDEGLKYNKIKSIIHDFYSLNDICKFKIDLVNGKADYDLIKSITKRNKGLRCYTRGKNVYSIYSTSIPSSKKSRIEQILCKIDLNLIKTIEFENSFNIEMLKQLNVLHWALEFWDIFENGGFDIIIGNPPYGRIKEIKNEELKEILSLIFNDASLFQLQHGNRNWYKIFLEQSLNILKDDGVMGQIFPTSFLGENDSKILRSHFFEENTILNILEFPEKTKVFKGEVTQDVTILISLKKSMDDYAFKIKTNISKDELNALDMINLGKIKRSKIHELSEDYRIPMLYSETSWDILDHLTNFPKINDHEINIGEGHLHESHDSEFLSDEKTDNLLVKGIHLDNYNVNLSDDAKKPRYIINQEKFFEKKPSAKTNTMISKKLIGRNTINRSMDRRLKFTIIPQNIVITNSIKYVVVEDDSIDYRTLLVLLNSKLLNWRFEIYSTQNNVRNYEIEKLPIAPISEKENEIIVFISELLIYLKTMNDIIEFNQLDHMMDLMIYEIYFRDKIKTSLNSLIYDDFVKSRDIDFESIEDKIALIMAITNNEEIKDEMNEIKSNTWVKIIEKIY